MKIEIRNQLVGVIIGAVIGIGINHLPGLSGREKMWVLVAAVIALSGAIKFLRAKYKGRFPGII